MSAQGEESEVAEPRWLTADQLEAWRGFSNLAQRLPIALEWQLQRDAQLSFIEYYVLALLSEQPEHRMRMSEVAARVNSELSRLSHMVSRLEKRGILCREPDPCDGRYTHAILTDAGFAYLEEAAPGHVERVRQLFIDALDPEELQTLRRCSEKVIARIDSAAEQAERRAPAGRCDPREPHRAAESGRTTPGC